jgi:hypothetical protein
MNGAILVDPKRPTDGGTIGRVTNIVPIRAITRKILAEPASASAKSLLFKDYCAKT